MNTELETITEEAPVVRPQFHICDEKSANWFLRRLANIDAEKKRVKANAEEITQQLDARADRLNYLYRAELEEYARQTLAASGNRRKSLTLLQGACAFRSVPAGVKIADKDAALLYAQVQGMESVLRVTIDLDASEYKRRALEMLQNGEDLASRHGDHRSRRVLLNQVRQGRVVQPTTPGSTSPFPATSHDRRNGHHSNGHQHRPPQSR